MNGWLICDEEDESSLDLDSVMQKDASSGCVRESGDRSEQPCRRLWEAIPQASRRDHCSTDLWKAAQAVIPEEHHTVDGQ